MAEPTIKVPNVVNADIPGLVTDPGTFFFNSDIDNLQYLNNAGNPINVGNADAIAQEIIVNATDGNDANVGGPYATYEAARVYAKTIASPTYKVLINIIGNQSITGSFTVSPYITLLGNLSGTITASGNVVLDTDFLALSNTTTYIQSCIIAAAGFPAVWGPGDQNIIFFIGCQLSGVPTFSNSSPNTNTFGNAIAFIGAADLAAQFFPSGVTINDALAAFIDVQFGGNPSITSTGALGARILLQKAGGYGQIDLNAAGPGQSICFMTGCSPTGVNMNSTFTQLITDVVSLSNDSLNFSGGATISQVQFDTNLAPMTVSTSLYTPTNYTITSPDVRVGPNSPLSHLNGIDLALGSLPANSTTIDGMTVNSTLGMNGPLGPVLGSHEVRVGNIVTGSVKFGFNAQSTNCYVIFNKSYGGAFTTTVQALGAGLVVKDPTAAIGDGVVSSVRSSTSFGVRVDMVVASTGVDYILEVNFSYQVI